MRKIACSGCSLQYKGLDTTLDLVKRAGFDAIELSGLNDEMKTDEKSRREILAQVEEAGLFIEALRWRGPDGIKIAADFGIPILATGNRAREGDKETFAEDIKRFKEAGKEAADYGIRICVKPHVGNYIHSTPTMMEFVERVDSENVGFMWDPSHLWRANEQPEETLMRTKDHIFAVRLRDHISREQTVDPAEIQIPGNGKINFQSVVNELLTIEGLETFCIEINNWGHRDDNNQWVKWSRDMAWESSELEQILNILTKARQSVEGYILKAEN
jgi:sugar phosphate isomerase/epimerase